jgi:hypothetical protein
VNLVYAQAMMNSQELDTDHLIAQREFTGEDGKAIFSSFWSGYVREKLLPILHDTSNDVFASEFGFIFIDVGTGELKFFGGNPNEDFTDFESAGQFGSMDGSVFREMVQAEMESDTPSGETINTAIRNYIGECKPSCRSMNIHCAASESMRQLREKNPEKFSLLINDLERLDIYFDVVSADDESKYEHAAIKYGLENGIDVDEAVSELILVGNLAWGNGSMQGVHSTHGSFARPFGLKNLKKEVERIIDSDDIGLKSIGLGSTLRIEGEGRKQTLVVSNLSSLEVLFENLDRFISQHV